MGFNVVLMGLKSFPERFPIKVIIKFELAKF